MNEEVRGQQYNLAIIWIMLGLTGIGILNLYSATFGIESESHYWKTQIWRFLVGASVAIGVFFVHYRVLERFAYAAYVVNILLLIAVLVLGRNILGAKRWLDLGFISLQPSEFMKITIAWTLAKYFHDDQQRGSYNLQPLLVPCALVILPVLLVMAQPDLGTALIILATALVIFLFVKINPKLLWTAIIAAIVFMPIAYQYVLKPYQKKRIVTFLNPYADPRGAGYNSIQSMIAVGSGGVTGKGFKQGTQSQLRFLPEHHTDFIFSVYSEEYGFLGSMVLLGLFLGFLSQCLKIAYSSNDKFGMLFSIGISAIFFFHVLINIGMTVGLMPVVGVPLPFLSYGGSFLMACMFAVGILANIANKKSMF